MRNETPYLCGVGADSVLRYTVNGESDPVCSLRVFFDRPKPNGDGEFEDKWGFWMDASRWGTRGESAARLLKKGSRVSVTGELYEETWQDKESG